ncbi:MAG TPA: diaminopimelate decarboxylase [Ktedonobacteraceae bacterium]|nr:diaminopimelate decarboxylase [Ktedonobacteraceae bacterium]
MPVQSDALTNLSHLLPDTATFSSDGVFHIAGKSVPELIQHYGYNTPLYIFDRTTIINACQRYQQAFRKYYHPSPVQILYASKAYLSPLVAGLVTGQGLGLDVVSGGELTLALRAHVPMERISFHGNNKSIDELRMALKSGVGRIVLDNWSELERLTLLAGEGGYHPQVLVRVAPDVDTDTHRYLQTGHAASKFGFPLANGEARAAMLRILQEGQLRLAGLHAHSGTMLRETRPYVECLRRLMALARDVYVETQWWPREISPGGGWAIDEPGQPPVPGIEVLAQALQATMEQELALRQDALPAPTLIIEPGRSIIGRAGVAVYRIGARKPTPGGVTYLFVDGGMADNIRPALYGARYTAFPVERAFAPAGEAVCISGRYCESGDMLIDQVMLPYMRENELLALPGVGAYCLPMSSNYNLVPRPIVLLVDEHTVQVMERQETYDDILSRYQQV